jgi:hypothetical protein
MFKVALEGVTREQTRFAFWVNLVYQCHSNNLYSETSDKEGWEGRQKKAS